MKLFFSILFVSLGLNLFAQDNFVRIVPFSNDKVEVQQFNLVPDNFNEFELHVPDLELSLILHEVKFNFQVVNELNEPQAVNYGRHFVGKILGNNNSIATLSISENEAICMFSDDAGNWELVSDLKSYTIRQIPSTINIQYECSTIEQVKPTTFTVGENSACKTVQIYFECDYKLFTDKGSNVQSVIDYISAVFTQVQLLYLNEGINVEISQIKVWTNPDPYQSSGSTASALSAFRSNLNGNFNGNLAALLTTRNLGGGIAYLDVLCFKQYAVSVETIHLTYNNVPTYSWTVEVITHELGHNFGSPHTQSCSWPGGAIDNCYVTEGGCPPGPAPVGGGTIMSYCHLTGYGINFSKGFGTKPGDLIRSKYNSASCLSGSGSYPTGLVSQNITSSFAKLTWQPVSGVTYYTLQYKKNILSSWTTIDLIQGTNMNLGGLQSGTLYDWRVKTECSGYSPVHNFTTLVPGNTCQVINGLNVSNITQTSAIFAWPQVQGALNYIFEFRPQISQSWVQLNVPTNSFTLNGLSPGTIYIARVRPDCNPTYSGELQFKTQDGFGQCPIPTNLSNDVVTSNWAKISWKPQLMANQYFLQIKLASGTKWFDLGPISVTTVIIAGLQPNTAYQWRVRSQCSDWSVAWYLITTFLAPEPPISDILVEVPKLKIYPNPTIDKIFIENNFDSSFKIVDLDGKVLIDDFYDSNIDLSGFNSGVYFLNVDNQWFKLIKF